MSDRLQLRKNVVYAVVEFVANVAMVFVSYRLVILAGGIEAVGVWATLFAWTSLIRLGDAGMANATLRFVAMRDVATDPDSVRAYIETGVIANTAIFVVLAVIGFCVMSPFVSGFVGEAHALEASRVLPWMFVSFLLLNVSGVVSGALQGLHLGFRRSQISMAGTLVQLVAAIVLVPRFGLLGLALAQMVQYGAMTVVAWLYVRRAAGITALMPLRFDRGAFRAMLGYSLKAQAANVANGLFEPLSKFLVAYFGGMAASGIYELAFKTVVLARNAVVSGLAALVPGMSSLADNTVRVSALYRSSVGKSRLAIAVVLAAVCLSAPLVSWLWLGSIRVDYWLYVLAIAAGFYVNTLGAAAYNLGLTTGQLGGNIVTAGGSVAALVVIGCLLGQMFGVHAVVGVVALCLAVGGVAIRLINERLLVAEAAA